MTSQELRDLFDNQVYLLHTDLSIFTGDFVRQAAAHQTIGQSKAHLAQMDRLVIFTDGSAAVDGGQAKWAFVVLAEKYGQAPLIVGWSAGEVVQDQVDPHHIGASELTSTQAERSALIWALWWRTFVDIDIPTSFCVDATSAIDTATGASLDADTSESALLLRSSYLALELNMPENDIALHHCRGHQGVFWNEVADTIATQFNADTSPPHAPGFDVRRWQAIVPHAWYILRPQPDMPQLQGSFLDISPPALPSLSADIDLDARRSEQASHDEPLTVEIGIATANVQTLYQGHGGGPGKIDFLQAQFHHAGLHMIGIQEARGSQGMWTNAQFIRIAAPSQEGELGVELWINVALPYAHSGTTAHYFAKQHFTVRVASPRLLVCRVEAPGIDTLAIVAHAPHAGIDQDVVAKFWEQLAATFVADSQENVFLMIDANATLGHSDGVRVLHLQDEPSTNSPHLRALMEAKQLFAPASALGHWSPTWISPDGRTARRIDHVLVSQKLSSQCLGASTLDDIELAIHGRDHRAAGVWLHWASSTPPARRRGHFTVDPLRIKNNSRLHQAIAAIPALPWNTDVDTQTNHFQQHMHAALRRTCGRQRAQPKKPFIDGRTWDLRNQLRQARADLKDKMRNSCPTTLRQFFATWKRCIQNTIEPVSMVPIVQAVLQVRQLQTALKKQLRTNKAHHIEQTMKDMPHSSSASQVLKTLRPYRGSSNAKFFGPPPLPMVRDEDGKPCHNAEEARARWLRFLAHMEGGSMVESSELREDWIANMHRFAAANIDIDIAEIPTIVNLECSFKKVAAGKATGPDGIPGEACRAHATKLARQIVPVLLKTALYGQEPLDYKGGRAVTAWKRKLPQDQCDAYRALLISSHIGKSIHRSLRDQHSQLYEAFLHRDQLGGRKRVPVTLGSHMAQAFLRHYHCRHQAVAILFLDLTQAFYRTLRELALGPCGNDESIARWVKALNLPPDTLHNLHHALAGDNAIEHTEWPTTFRNAIRLLHCSTWFTLGNHDQVIKTSVGSRPGDCFADIVFGLLFGQVVHRLEQTMVAEGLDELIPLRQEPGLWSCPGDAQTRVMGPIWMDDLALCLHSESCTELVSKAARVTGHLYDLCRAHGLSPNLSPGKTEVLMSFRGRDHRSQKLAFFGPQASGTLPVVTNEGVIDVRVVGKYKHLGTLLHHGGCQNQEMSHQFAMAHQSFKENSRLLLRNRNLPLRTRVRLFESVVLSKLTYGMGSWIFSSPKAEQQFAASLGRLYRRLCSHRPDAHLVHGELCAELSLPDGPDLLRRERLRYLGTVYRSADTHAWSVILLDDQWSTRVREDLVWMWEQLRHSSALPDPRTDPAHWQRVLLQQPKYWKKLVGRAVAHSIRQANLRWEVQQAHKRCAVSICEHFDIPRAATTHLRSIERHGCLHCGKQFKSKAGEAVHMCRAHGRTAKERTLFATTQCGACLKEFHTRGSILRHLHHSHTCRSSLLQQGVCLTPVPGIGSREEAVLAQCHDGILPSLQAHGPTFPLGGHMDFADYNIDLENAIFHFLVDAPESNATINDVETFLREWVNQHPIGWSEWCATLAHVSDSYGSQEAEQAGLSQQQVHQLLQHMATYEAWPFMQEESFASMDNPVTVEHWHQELERLVVETMKSKKDRVPRHPGGHRIFLHLFAGRRRPGDLQFYIDRWTPPQGVLFHVISVDIIHDAVWGDLRDPRTRQFWLHAVRQQWVLALVSGPPCETWSQARYHQLSEQSSGPRPLRSAQELWGLGSLRIREVDQVALGNSLLTFSVEAIIDLALNSGLAVLEHPAEPDEPEKPSIWRLPLVAWLASLPEVQIVRLQQGFFGAPSPKPTNLLLLNLPKGDVHLWDQRSCLIPPNAVSIGKSESGQYRTSPLKEYPPALCKALADMLCVQAEQVGNGCAEPTPSFWSTVAPMRAAFGRTIGADYSRP
eukprot:Skav236239  [mRNA]  locus=scaffold829:211005:216797:+ [translate_table: standard]